MKNFINLIKKSSLYIVAMLLALTVTYFLGVVPLLHAQPTSEGVADFPELPSTAPVSAPPTSINEKPELSPPQPEHVQPQQVEGPPSSVPSAQSSSSSLPSEQSPAPEPSGRSSEGGVYFQFTPSYIGDMNNPDRDPFRKPLYILELEEQIKKPQKTEVVTIDDRIEAIRRWPLREYKLVGIIWDVSSPKAMIVDPANTMHLLKRNYRIGNKNGIISMISEGGITVVQENIPVVIAIAK